MVFSIVALLLLSSCKNSENSEEITMTVTATAYNSTEAQTKKGDPFLTAWGDTLQAEEKAIAVSRDLIELGLDHNQEVEIDGFPGTYIVKDKMNKRWTNKIDIYMGLDEEAALEWGKQKVEITFDVLKADGGEGSRKNR
ncbi:3D domain-containing protein [Psychroflexus sp. CAK8W]|uniref:3D domain-containing protein n=1 Tax=Psychroflexus longus TaxID=2873596 RepID=A0ABS7XG67_9FLAO|nr:3D domain-containing protein [Psychroflexus longus]MBZ9777504.1 3D domain-containing protein [Psychroflexus longus]